MRFSNYGKITILVVHVDDIILIGDDDIVEMDKLKKNLAKELAIKDLGLFKYFLWS